MSDSRSETVERTLTQSDFDAFAELSGDKNSIHINAEFAARSRFGRTVAHGMLLSSILRGVLEKLLPGGRQLSQELMFAAPTFAGEPMRFSARIEETSGDCVSVALSCTRIDDELVTCSGVTQVRCPQ